MEIGFLDAACGYGKWGTLLKLNRYLHPGPVHALAASADRRARWLTDAEEKPMLDELGLPIIINGKLLSNLDHRALAAHDRNNLSALELQAKIAGVYSDETSTTSINIALLVPPTLPPDAPGNAPQPQGGASELSARRVHP